MTSVALSNAPGARQEHHPRFPFFLIRAAAFVSLAATSEQDTPTGIVYIPPLERRSWNAFEVPPPHRQPPAASIGSRGRSDNTTLRWLFTVCCRRISLQVSFIPEI